MKQSLKRAVALGVGAVLAAAALAGCSSGGAGADQPLVGYSTYTVSNPFFAGMLKGLKAGAKKHNFELVTTNANSDPAQQVTDIENLVNRGVKYILLTPADGKAIAPAIAAANAAHIPVISIADSVQPKIAATIQVNDKGAGEEAAKQIADFLTKKNGSPKGNVVNITGIIGTPSGSHRSEGFVEAIKKYPDIKVVATSDGQYDTQQSNAAMSSILQANPQVDAVFCGNDAEAIGVTAAIKAANRFKPVGQPGHIYVIGVDGSKPSIEDVRNSVQDASISQNPIKMSEKAMDIVSELESGKKVGGQIDWPSQLITKENIDSDEVKSYGIWADEV